MWRLLVLLTCLVLVTPVTGFGQGTDAGLVGIVRGPDSLPIADVTVEARHGATGYRARAVTNAAGRYVMPALPLGGPWTLTARRPGFQPATRSGIVLTIGARPAVDLELAPVVTTLAQVAVREEGMEGREARVGGSTRVTRAQVDALPVIDRNFASLASIDPLVGPQLSLGGQRWTTTDIRIDGVQSRNMLRAGEANAGPYAIPLDAVREFEVNSAVFDASQGRQGGGQLAVATRFGTNQSEGRVFLSFRNEQLAGSTDFQGRPRDARQGQFVQSGLSAGGAIVPDRVHYFFAYERQDSSEPLFTGDVSTARAQVAASINKDSLARVIDVLGRLYGTPGGASQYGRLERAPLAQTGFARLDWQASPEVRANLRFTLSRWNSPLSGGVDQPIALQEARSDYSSGEHQVLGTLSQVLGRATHHEVQVAYNRSRRDLEPRTPGVPRGFVQVRSVLPDGTTGNTTVQFGGNRLAPDASREWSVQVRDRLSIDRGRVLYSLGMDHMLSSMHTLIAEAQSGLFVFPSIAALEARQPNRFARTVPLSGRSPETSQRVLELGAYAQAEWRASDQVTLTGGLRWDATRFLSAAPRNGPVDQAFAVSTSAAPRDWLQLQPRAQLVWRPSSRRDVIRLGAGIFAGQVPYYAQHNQLLYDGSSVADIDLRGSSTPVPDYIAYRNDPATVPGLAGAAPPSYVNVIGTFSTPRTLKTNLAWERRIRHGLVTTLGVQHLRANNLYHYVDRNLASQPAFRVDNEGGRAVWVPASSIPPATGVTDVRRAAANPAFSRVIALESPGESHQTAITANATFHLGARVQGGAGYAWNRARDNSTYGCCLARTATSFTPVRDDPRDLSQAWGASDLDTRHRLVGTFDLRGPLGITFAARYTAASGRPFSLVVDGDVNGDEANGNDLAFLFDPDDPRTDPAVAASMRRLLANEDNLARDYIQAHLGRMAGRNTIYTPWTHRVDLRARRDFSLFGASRVALTVDVFNAANLLNRDWGAQYALPVGISSQNPVVNRIPLLRIVGFDATTQRFRYTVNEQAGVLAKTGEPYQVQVGVRIDR